VTGVRVVSLKTDTPQSIPPGPAYQVVRFPYPDQSYDAWSMHQPVQPDGRAVTSWSRDDRSGLIWPTCTGWASVYALAYWEAGDYREVRSRIVRDPLRAPEDGGPDSTDTEDDAANPGGQFRSKSWGMFVNPETPLALMVRHDSPTTERLVLAEFKVAIHPVEEP
jgi:hypothetical protein